MSGRFTVINSEISLTAFIANVTKLYNDHKYITYDSPRLGADRSISQNSLFHVWISELASYYTGINKSKIPTGVKEGMKRTVKREFLIDNPKQSKWMTISIRCPKTGNKKKDYSSSSNWKTGEMFMVLTWLQNKSAEDGCILESIGVFKKQQEKQHET